MHVFGKSGEVGREKPVNFIRDRLYTGMMVMGTGCKGQAILGGGCKGQAVLGTDTETISRLSPACAAARISGSCAGSINGSPTLDTVPGGKLARGSMRDG